MQFPNMPKTTWMLQASVGTLPISWMPRDCQLFWRWRQAAKEDGLEFGFVPNGMGWHEQVQLIEAPGEANLTSQRRRFSTVPRFDFFACSWVLRHIDGVAVATVGQEVDAEGCGGSLHCCGRRVEVALAILWQRSVLAPQFPDEGPPGIDLN